MVDTVIRLEFEKGRRGREGFRALKTKKLSIVEEQEI